MKLPKFVLLFCIFASFSELVWSKGVFELRLLSYKNSNSRDFVGNCCGQNSENSGNCQNSCSTFFRICLKEYQTTIDLNSKCTYGSRITNLIPQSNSNDFSQKLGFEVPLEFDFSFAWPGYYTLILEAYHNSTGQTTESGTLNQLLMRVAQHGNIKPGLQWHRERSEQGPSSLEFEYRVQCAEHYFGEQCSVSCRPRDDSFGHFSCGLNGEKMCLPGWQGRFCNEARCAPGCSLAHGSCKVPNECVCEMGWVGPRCSECQRYPGCQKGTCRKPFECTCQDGWGGIFCNQDLNYCTHHRPCMNGGVCTNTGQGHYTCGCLPGYTGTNCETKIQDCSMSPCLNGGLCQNLETNYTCSCPENFSGRHCQINAKTCADTPCTNGASCVNSFDGSYQCICTPGWTGANCDIEQDECQSDPCLNGGRCVDRFNDYKCVCPVGFEGLRCQTNINDCSETTCQNGGRCLDDINNFRCECPAGFSGTLCQYNIDDCIKRPCANGGTCFDEVNGFSCMCRPGFKGKDCAIDINECTSNPCRNSGVCEDLVDDYRCRCPPCFSGKNCETRHDDCRFSNTFRPTFTEFTTPSYPAGGFYGGRKEPQASGRSASENLMIIVIATIAALAVIIIVLVIGVCCLYRRWKRNERADEERQNDRNQRIAARTQPDCINNKFVSSIPQTAVVSPFTKIDNTERSANLKGKNLDRLNSKEFSPESKAQADVNFDPYPLTVTDRNTFKPRPVGKAVSVEKLNYSQKCRAAAARNQSINTQPRKGFEGRGCISPTPQSPREVSLPSPPPFLKTEISKDSGLGSPLSEEMSSPRLPTLASSESCSDLETPCSSLTVSVVSSADFLAAGHGQDSPSSPGGESSRHPSCGAPSPLRHHSGRTLSPRGSGELMVCATGMARQQEKESGREAAASTGKPGPGSSPARTFHHQVHRHGPRPKPPPRHNSSRVDEYATQV